MKESRGAPCKQGISKYAYQSFVCSAVIVTTVESHKIRPHHVLRDSQVQD